MNEFFEQERNVETIKIYPREEPKSGYINRDEDGRPYRRKIIRMNAEGLPEYEYEYLSPKDKYTIFNPPAVR